MFFWVVVSFCCLINFRRCFFFSSRTFNFRSLFVPVLILPYLSSYGVIVLLLFGAAAAEATAVVLVVVVGVGPVCYVLCEIVTSRVKMMFRVV